MCKIIPKKNNKIVSTKQTNTKSSCSYRQRRDSDPSFDVPDLHFDYTDSDTLFNEIAELYSYSEVPEFQVIRGVFEQTLTKYFKTVSWIDLTREQQRSFIYYLLEKCEVVSPQDRLDAARCFLYLAHGNYMYGIDEIDILQYSRANVFLMIEAGVFPAIVELLALEKEKGRGQYDSSKSKITIADNVVLRTCLSVMYIMIEVTRREDHFDLSPETKLREAFLDELRKPVYGDDNLTAFLFHMLLNFCNGSMPHYPIRKILLLIWKSILASLGGIEQLNDLKREARIEAKLNPFFVETKPARPLVLPTAAYDPRGNAPMPSHEVSQIPGLLSRPVSMISEPDTLVDFSNQKGLDFRPKARKKDIEMFIEMSRSKFGCYEAPGTVSDPLMSDVSGLPAPIQESIKVLREHVYIPLSEIQIAKDEELEKRIKGTNEPVPTRDTPTEILYKSILSNLPQYMIAILKVLLAAAPTSRTRSESLNIFVDVIPADTPANMMESAQNTIDINRHKEIIVKAVSATLFLLLKHFKINHIYQFEYISQHLVFANCIPLILKFFNQNVMQYVTARNNFPALNFPGCVLVPPEGASHSVDIADAIPTDPAYCWRNLFSCINLIRILQKLTKWKHSRTVMLVVFRSAPILKRALKVRHPLMQLYVLKLLKVQTKYLGRNWRKSHMKIMSAMYRRVRHHFHDDWAYGNDLDAKPWDFQTEEYALKNCVEHFNAFYYENEGLHGFNPFGVELQPMEINYLSVLGEPIELSQSWQENYEHWLEVEVFQHPTDWDEMLKSSQSYLVVKPIDC